MINRERDPGDLERMWKDFASEARSGTEKMAIVNGVYNIVDDWSFAVVEFFLEDENDKVSYRAEQALERMEERRSRLNPSTSEEDDNEEEEEEGE